MQAAGARLPRGGWQPLAGNQHAVRAQSPCPQPPTGKADPTRSPSLAAVCWTLTPSLPGRPLLFTTLGVQPPMLPSWPGQPPGRARRQCWPEPSAHPLLRGRQGGGGCGQQSTRQRQQQRMEPHLQRKQLGAVQRLEATHAAQAAAAARSSRRFCKLLTRSSSSGRSSMHPQHLPHPARWAAAVQQQKRRRAQRQRQGRGRRPAAMRLPCWQPSTIRLCEWPGRLHGS